MNNVLLVTHDAGDKLRGVYLNGVRLEGVMQVEHDCMDAPAKVTLTLAVNTFTREAAPSK